MLSIKVKRPCLQRARCLRSGLDRNHRVFDLSIYLSIDRWCFLPFQGGIALLQLVFAYVTSPLLRNTLNEQTFLVVSYIKLSFVLEVQNLGWVSIGGDLVLLWRIYKIHTESMLLGEG